MKSKLRTLINATPDIICFKNGDGSWLEANKAILDLFVCKKKNIKGKKVWSLQSIPFQYLGRHFMNVNVQMKRRGRGSVFIEPAREHNRCRWQEEDI